MYGLPCPTDCKKRPRRSNHAPDLDKQQDLNKHTAVKMASVHDPHESGLYVMLRSVG